MHDLCEGLFLIALHSWQVGAAAGRELSSNTAGKGQNMRCLDPGCAIRHYSHPGLGCDLHCPSSTITSVATTAIAMGHGSFLYRNKVKDGSLCIT